MNADEARTVIKSLGEFAHVGPHTDPGFVILSFVKYYPGVSTGRFHCYKHLTVSTAVYEEIKHELKL